MSGQKLYRRLIPIIDRSELKNTAKVEVLYDLILREMEQMNFSKRQDVAEKLKMKIDSEHLMETL